MNQFIKNLHEVKELILKTWSRITEKDLTESKGDVKHIKARLQEAYGFSDAQAQKEFDDFIAKHNLKIGRQDNSDTLFHPENPIVSPSTPIVPKNSKIIT